MLIAVISSYLQSRHGAYQLEFLGDKLESDALDGLNWGFDGVDALISVARHLNVSSNFHGLFRESQKRVSVSIN